MLRSKIPKKKNQVIHANSRSKSHFDFYFNNVSIMINSWYTYIYILPPIWLPHYWNTGRCIEPSAKSLRVLASSCCVDDQFFFPKKTRHSIGREDERRWYRVSSLLIDPFPFFPQFQFIRNLCYSRIRR